MGTVDVHEPDAALVDVNQAIEAGVMLFLKRVVQVTWAPVGRSIGKDGIGALRLEF